MKRSFAAQKGMSLVEVTIILLVLMLLTSVLAPSIYDLVVDARGVKVKEDCEAIGVSVMRLVRDVGPCLKVKGSDTSCTAQAFYSRGTNGDNPSTQGWPTTAGSVADMEEQFATNTDAGAIIYSLPTTSSNFGWRGAYLPSPIGPDPWGVRYGVNTKFLDPSQGPEVDVFCISGGPNQKYDTAFAGNTNGGTTRGGDDFTYVIAGSQTSRLF